MLAIWYVILGLQYNINPVILADIGSDIALATDIDDIDTTTIGWNCE